MLDPSNTGVAGRLREAMARADIGPTELARLIGVTLQAVRGWLAKGEISRPNIWPVSQALGVSSDWLLSGQVEQGARMQPPTLTTLARYRAAGPTAQIQAIRTMLGAGDDIDVQRLHIAVQVICDIKEAENPDWDSADVAAWIVDLYRNIPPGESADQTRERFLRLVKG